MNYTVSLITCARICVDCYFTNDKEIFQKLKNYLAVFPRKREHRLQLAIVHLKGLIKPHEKEEAQPSHVSPCRYKAIHKVGKIYTFLFQDIWFTR